MGGYNITVEESDGTEKYFLIEAENEEEAKQIVRHYTDGEIKEIKRLYTKRTLPGWAVPIKRGGIY